MANGLSSKIEEKVRGRKSVGQKIDPYLYSKIESAIKKESGVEPMTDEDISKILGQKSLGPAGLDDVVARMSISMADTFNEKWAAFKGRYPKGDLTVVQRGDGGKELFFKRSPIEKWARVDAPLLEKFEPLNDIAEFVATDMGAIFGESLALYGGKGVRLGRLMARLFTGGTAGQLGQELLEPNEEDLYTLIQRSVATGGTGALVGGPAGVGLARLGSGLSGGGFLRVEEPGRRALLAGDRLAKFGQERGITVPQLLPSQVSEHPIIQKIGGQSSATTGSIGEYIRSEARAANSVMRALVNKPAAMQAPHILYAEMRAAEDAAMRDIASMTRPTGFRASGQNARRRVRAWNRLSSKIVRDAYSQARAIEEPLFNYEHLVGELAQAGTLSRDPAVRGVATQLMPHIRAAAEGKPIVIDVGGVKQTITPLELLRATRTQLWDLKTPDVQGVMRADEYWANRIYRSITNTIRNPQNRNPEFISKWKHADALARERFTTLDSTIIRQVLNTETPGQLMRRLVKPGNGEIIARLSGVIGYRRMRDIKDAFINDLLQSPDGIRKKLDQFDVDTLKEILPWNEHRALQALADAAEATKASGLQKILNTQKGHINVIEQIADTGNTATIKDFVRKYKGNISMRSALIDHIYLSSRETIRGTKQINPKILTELLEKYNKNGMLGLLTMEEKKLLLSHKLYSEYAKQGLDAGTSIQAAEAVSGFRGFLAGNATSSAIATILEHIGVGRLFTSGAGRFLLIGTGRKQFDPRLLGATSAALAQAFSEEELFFAEEGNGTNP